jgi:hypothetical protein
MAGVSIAFVLCCTALSVVHGAALGCASQGLLVLEPSGGIFASASGAAVLQASATAVQLSSGSATTATVGGAILSSPFRILNGFRASFSFKVGPTGAGSPGTAEGFAFVLLRSPSTQASGTGAGLGYNIPNSVAVEFDMHTDSGIADTAGNNHVEVHTLYGAGTNTADNSARLPGGGDPGVQMANGASHTVVINFVPTSVAGGTSYFTVQLDSVPVLNIAVNLASLEAMFPLGTAYFGFTGSTGVGLAANLVVSSVQVRTVPISPSKSFFIGLPTVPISAAAALATAAPPQAQLQLVDACGSYLLDSPSLVPTAALVGVPSGSASGISVVDQGSALYSIFFFVSRAAIPSTTVQLDVRYNGVRVGSGLLINIQVSPGPPSATQSSLLNDVPSPSSGSFTAGVAKNFKLVLRDALGNLAVMPTAEYAVM